MQNPHKTRGPQAGAHTSRKVSSAHLKSKCCRAMSCDNTLLLALLEKQITPSHHTLCPPLPVSVFVARSTGSFDAKACSITQACGSQALQTSVAALAALTICRWCNMFSVSYAWAQGHAREQVICSTSVGARSGRGSEARFVCCRSGSRVVIVVVVVVVVAAVVEVVVVVVAAAVVVVVVVAITVA